MESLWYSCYRGNRAPKVQKLSRQDLNDKTVPYRLALGMALGLAGYRPVQNLDGTVTWRWPRQTGNWWALPASLIEQIDEAYFAALDSAAGIGTGVATISTLARILNAQIAELGGITMTTDMRIAGRSAFPKKILERIAAAEASRRDCDDINVYLNDWLIIELSQPVKKARG